MGRGQIAAPDDDLMADMYDLADEAFEAAGMPWYELSNWAVPGQECRHNEAYWRGDDWWGVGPGAHSHVAGTRWWNVKHPAAYVQRLAAGDSPAVGREVLDPATRAVEDLMLGIRMATGFGIAELGDDQRAEVSALVAQGLGTVVDGQLPAHQVRSAAGRCGGATAPAGPMSSGDQTPSDSTATKT